MIEVHLLQLSAEWSTIITKKGRDIRRIPKHVDKLLYF